MWPVYFQASLQGEGNGKNKFTGNGKSKFIRTHTDFTGTLGRTWGESLGPPALGEADYVPSMVLTSDKYSRRTFDRGE